MEEHHLRRTLVLVPVALRIQQQLPTRLPPRMPERADVAVRPAVDTPALHRMRSRATCLAAPFLGRHVSSPERASTVTSFFPPF